MNEQQDTRLAAIHDAVTEIQATCKGCRLMLARHDDAIYGDNGDGMRGRLTATEVKLKGVEESGRRVSRRVWAVLTGVIVSLAGAVFNWMRE